MYWKTSPKLHSNFQIRHYWLKTPKAKRFLKILIIQAPLIFGFHNTQGSSPASNGRCSSRLVGLPCSSAASTAASNCSSGRSACLWHQWAILGEAAFYASPEINSWHSSKQSGLFLQRGMYDNFKTCNLFFMSWPPFMFIPDIIYIEFFFKWDGKVTKMQLLPFHKIWTVFVYYLQETFTA